MLEEVKQTKAGSLEVPDFLIKSTLGCSLVAVLILLPFTIASFMADRLFLGIATSTVSIACCVNVWNGREGRYSLALNAYLVTPAGALTVMYAFLQVGSPASFWPFLIVLAYYAVLPERYAQLFNVATILVVLPMAWLLLDQPSAVRFSAVILGVSMFAYISMREINSMHDRLRERAVTDPLTGLLNRSLLESSLQHSIAQSERSGVPMALLALDVDDFKGINDSRGHDAGDRVLRALSDLLRQRTRSGDLAFRVGGDEFQILLHNTSEANAAKVAEEFRQRVERALLLPDHRVTVSIGVCGLADDMDAEQWIKTCDERLYRAKDRGRNRVET